MIVSGLLLVALALAQGYVGIPLFRRPHRPGDGWRVSLQMRHRWRAADRIPDWVTLVVLAVGLVGWLVSKYG
jgi:hypothetical protein